MSEAYSRLYHRFSAEFPEVYADDRALACWVRLLVLADASWPMRPPVPRSARDAAVRTLVSAGLLTLSGDTYCVRGLDAERSRRTDSARSAAAKRWQSESNAGAYADGMPRRDETSRDETSRDETSTRDAHRKDLDAFLAVKFRLPTEAQRKFLDTYCRVFDLTGPERAERLIFANPDDPIGALKADLVAFRAERREEASKAEAPKPVRRKGSGLTGVSAELAKLFAEQAAAQAEATGAEPEGDLSWIKEPSG